MAIHPIRHISLCAGAGGLDLGLKLALGWDRVRTVAYVEREAYAAAVLVARMEDQAVDSAPIWDELDTFDGAAWRGAVDIISAGFPCQPFSTAGKRLGKADERCLWPEVRRVLEECRPAFVFLENVSAVIPQPGIEWVRALEALGYQVKDDCFSAEEVGAPYEGIRWFALGAATGAGRLEARDLPTETEGSERERYRVRTVRPWTAESEPVGVAGGVADGMDRCKACGNGVVPLQAAYAFCTLATRLLKP